MIYQTASILGVILLYLFFYYAAGTIVLRLFPSERCSIPRILILGFFLYHFLFSIICLPLKVTLQPLKMLSILWAGILVLMTAAFLLILRKQRHQHSDLWRSSFQGKELYATLALLALILIQVILFNLNDETYAIWDQSYYLGDSVTSLYTNTISQYDPYTGRILKYLHSEYLLETYQNHTSVMSQLLGIHPMIENLTVMASVVIILYQLIFFEIGKLLFSGSRAKSALMTGFLGLLNFFSFNLFTAAEFLIIRPSEGKTILAVLILPALLYFFMETAAHPEQKCWWTYSFLAILGSFGLNMSSIFMIPFELSALYLPMAIRRKKFSVALRYLVLMIPCVIFAVLYLLTKSKFLIYTGK